MASYLLAHKKTGGNEGGYAHVIGDTGDETYAGISRKWFPNWVGWPIIDRIKKQRSIKHNEIIHELDSLVFDFYKEIFWDAVGGDDIDDQAIAERLYDFGVNAGQPKSIKQIQVILGIPNTGKIDSLTIEAINNPGKYLV